MKHRESHPEPVEGCFGCQTLNVGVQTLQIKHGKNPIHNVPVIGEEGPRAGKTVGRTAEHWDGKQDATVFAPALKLKTEAREM